MYTCIYVYLHTYIHVQVQVSFAEYRLFYRALLQKRPMNCIYVYLHTYIHVQDVLAYIYIASEYHTQNYKSLLQKSLAKESYILQM